MLLGSMKHAFSTFLCWNEPLFFFFNFFLFLPQGIAPLCPDQQLGLCLPHQWKGSNCQRFGAYLFKFCEILSIQWNCVFSPLDVTVFDTHNNYKAQITLSATKEKKHQQYQKMCKFVWLLIRLFKTNKKCTLIFLIISTLPSVKGASLTPNIVVRPWSLLKT